MLVHAIRGLLKPDDNMTKLLFKLFEHPGDVDVRDIIRTFVKYKADVNGVSHTRRTPLRLACHNNLTSSVIELIHQGARYEPGLKIPPNSIIEKVIRLNFHGDEFTVNDFYLLHPLRRDKITAMMLARLSNAQLQLLPIELLEIIFSYL